MLRAACQALVVAWLRYTSRRRIRKRLWIRWLWSSYCDRLDGVLAVYAFGSRIQGMAGERSDLDLDLDLAVLVQGYADPLTLWDLAGEAADIAGCPVDLLDLRRASTVMQQQVLTKGER